MAVEKNIDKILFDVCKAFNSEGISYVLIGGWAVIIHGFPRLTNDIDFLIEDSDENIRKIKNVLRKIFNDKSIDEIKHHDIAEYSVVRYVSPDGVSIDLMARIGNVADFKSLSKHIVQFEVLGNEIPVLDVEALIKLKDTIRDKDKMDLAFLKEKLKKRSGILKIKQPLN
ncbi:MAG: nucleotidyl transferase AbiEii/AbiGii toxin family protein [Thermodesulfovibrionales bacterium]|nr:nucleotidyl transferase AbiEii/AbiGii toxin family protein [Nitrospinota bacterium]MCG2710442.1 nucleotidyl transferase AbiEii/AbiGii toxin family protein [Thermodesulfovibrionales bacterium]MCG2813741.1 nucleotidyl transferase AbiEii/AbiGii toxin family protein [Thermodesulfovibrionales bacterium]MDP3048847.1 nucleotidyl transferase AbiEii/AbiGii toxin family protein [Thermodesulfovibrionales bacterium]